MAGENVELARFGYEAFNRGDIDAALDRCAPDVEWHDVDTPDTPAVKGRDAVRAYLRR
jgi:ketosteroid isomerase-like protein